LKELENIGDFFKSLEQEQAREIIDASIQNLINGLRSSEADGFTRRINDFYVKQNLTDENGNIIKVSTPGEALRRIIMNYDQHTGEFSLSPEEERWLRSDKLYGKNILGRLGFQYTNL